MYQYTFSPIKIGKMELKNRLVIPAMETSCSDTGAINDKIIDYWVERAKAGWGLLTVEVAAIDPQGLGFPNSLTLYDEDGIPGYKKLTDAVHEYGAKISIQLHHAGRQTSSAVTGQPIVAASAVPTTYMPEMPRELTTEEVYDVIEKYGNAAAIAQKAGFDAVEIHAGHGYLPATFLSPSCNRRTDEFGGSIEGRAKFTMDIIRNIKKKTGDDFPVIVKISGDERIEDGLGIEDSRLISVLLEKAGADAIVVSVGTGESMGYVQGPMNLPVGFNLDASSVIKHSVHIPVVGLGKVHEPYLIEDALKEGKADLIAIGRGSIADPNIPDKMKNGNIDDICPCIYCCQSCIESVFKGEPLSCLVNPFAGNVKEMPIVPTTTPKNIMVVGSGPSGLECAWLAAKRGHKVTVYEKALRPGGQFYLASLPPTKSPISKAIKYYLHMGKKYGVDYKYGVEVTEETIRKENPDTVVVATGGVPAVPNIPGIHGDNVITAVEVLKDIYKAGQNVLVIGGGSVGLETADFLGKGMRNVTVLEMLDKVGADVSVSVIGFLMERIVKRGIKCITNAKVTEILNDGVKYHKGGQECQLTDFDTIVLAMGVKSYDPISGIAKEMGKEVYVIGDAAHTDNAASAIKAGAILGIEI